MSGGHFDYKQYELGYIADAIQTLVDNNEDKTENEWGDTKGRGYSKKTIREFKKAIRVIREALIYAQRVDWLVSDDDGEDTFHKRLKEDLSKLN